MSKVQQAQDIIAQEKEVKALWDKYKALYQEELDRVVYRGCRPSAIADRAIRNAGQRYEDALKKLEVMRAVYNDAE